MSTRASRCAALHMRPRLDVGLAVDELDDVAGQGAVELLDRPLEPEQHVEALVDREQP